MLASCTAAPLANAQSATRAPLVTENPSTGFLTSPFDPQRPPATEPFPLDREPTPLEKPIGAELETLDRSKIIRPRRQVPPFMVFQVASWNLISGSPEAARKSRISEPAWRHTFGAERRTPGWRKVDASKLKADIIALQGVTSVREVRARFNANQFQVITSRQLLTRSTISSAGITTFRSDAPASTAVVYRRRKGLHSSGIRHFLPDPAKNEPPAITAFRLRVHRKMFWVVSLDLPTNCTLEMATDACRPYAAMVAKFMRWAQLAARQKAAVILLGRWPAAIRDELRTIGFEPGEQIDQAVDCASATANMLVAMPAEKDSAPHMFSNSTPAASTPCAATAELKIILR
jgi:hypothetical protein